MGDLTAGNVRMGLVKDEVRHKSKISNKIQRLAADLLDEIDKIDKNGRMIRIAQDRIEEGVIWALKAEEWPSEADQLPE